MIKAQYSDKNLIVQILTESFDANKSVNYVIKQDRKRNQRIQSLMEYSFEMCWNFGEVYLSRDRKGTLLTLLPEKKKSVLKAIWLDVKLILQAIGVARVAQILKRERIIKQNHPKDFIYLWYVGVQPGSQGQGVGSSLLRDLISLANKQKLTVYLETSTLENLPLYKRFGFEIYNTAEFDTTLYMLKKETDGISGNVVPSS